MAVPTPEVRLDDRAPSTLAVSGDLVFDTAARALSGARDALSGARHDVLDLGGVARVDSAGLACVLAMMAVARRNGVALRVAHPPEDLVALARVCEVESLLTA